jgi:nitric oxide dioxygenase
MTPEQVRLVETSFEAVKPIAAEAATLFYGRLFEFEPEAKPLFSGDMAEQGRKLMATLGTVVANLGRFESILPAVQQLAVRHVDWGVRPAHYTTVGEALLWTLGQGLGSAFTPEVDAAWRAGYTALSGVMLAAAYPEDRSAA